jgi:hypothetical protein
MTLDYTPCRLLGPTGIVGGVETSCHTRLPSLNYAGSNVQPSVTTHSLTAMLGYNNAAMFQTDVVKQPIKL